MLDIILVIILHLFNSKVKEFYAMFKQCNTYNYLCTHGYLKLLGDMWNITKYIDCVIIFYVPIKVATIVLGLIL